MIALPVGVKIFLAMGQTDMRKGFDGLASLAQAAVHQDPFSGHLFVFRGPRGDLIKVLYWAVTRRDQPLERNTHLDRGSRPDRRQDHLDARLLRTLEDDLLYRRVAPFCSPRAISPSIARL